MTKEIKPKDTPKAETQHAQLYSLIALLFVGQLALGGYVYYREKIAPTASSGEASTPEAWMMTLEEIVSEQQQEIEALRGTLEAFEDISGAAERFNLQQETLLELDERLAAIESKENALAISGPMTEWQFTEMKRMTQELRDLREQIERDGRKQMTLIQQMTAFDRLEEKVLSHKPYAHPLAAFKITMPESEQTNSWLSVLKPWQHDGVPSWQIMQAQFESARDAALSGEEEAAKNGSILSKVGSNLSGLVQVRKVGPSHGGDDLESILARAGHAAEQRNAAALIEELNALPNDKRGYFEELAESLMARDEILGIMPDIRSHLQAQTGVSEQP